MRTLLAWVFAVFVIAWASWIVALPAMLDRAPAPGPAGMAAALTYRIAGLVCHQDGARSFHVGQWPMPVCARCTGLYLGAVCGAFGGLAWWLRHSRGGGSLAVPLRTVRVVLLVAAIPTAVLWVAEWVVAAPVSNVVRAAGGTPLGAAVSWTVTIAILGVAMTDTPPPSPSASSRAKSS